MCNMGTGWWNFWGKAALKAVSILNLHFEPILSLFDGGARNHTIALAQNDSSECGVFLLYMQF